MTQQHCGYTLVDAEGDQWPCERPATGWRWYQDVAHEDSLDPACEHHSNEGGQRIHDAEAMVARVRDLQHLWESLADDPANSDDFRSTVRIAAAALKLALDDARKGETRSEWVAELVHCPHCSERQR